MAFECALGLALSYSEVDEELRFALVDESALVLRWGDLGRWTLTPNLFATSVANFSPIPQASLGVRVA